MKKVIVAIFILMATINIAEERPREIINLENRIAAEKDRNKAAKLLNEYENTFARYLENNKNDEYKIFFLGDQYFREKKYERAAQIFSKNLDSARNMFGAATSYRFIGNYTKAIDFYSGALALDQNLYEGYLGRGLAYKEQGDLKKARVDVETYFRYSITVDGYLALIDIYLGEGDVDLARALLTDARVKFPESQILKEILASTYLK